MHENEFYTFREYMKKEVGPLTASMEDYLEMIYRLCLDRGYTRINDLAAALNVQPPSATKMVQKLAEIGLLNYERYGIIKLNKKGLHTGKLLLERHHIIEKLLKLLGLHTGVLEETEKIEHTISNNTLKCFCDFVSFLETRPDVIRDLHEFLKIKKKR